MYIADQVSLEERLGSVFENREMFLNLVAKFYFVSVFLSAESFTLHVETES